MTTETGERIYSNDYFDVTFPNYGLSLVVNQFPEATFLPLGPYATVAYIPTELITEKTISQYGYSLIPTLSGIVSHVSFEASNISKIRSIPKYNLRGKGVLIGIIDTGIDYLNPLFINADNTTKIAALWDQTIIGSTKVSNTVFGTEYSREQINEALQSQTPYEIVPSRDEIGHGTMLAGIAAGNEVPSVDFAGVVPDSELIVVKLKPAKKNLKDFWKVPDNVICYQENDIQFAINYVIETATRLGHPLSLCLALGNSQTSHDNKSKINFGLSALSERRNVALTIAAGNEGLARRHYYGQINPTLGYDSVKLNVAENENGFTMELWGDSPGLFAIDLITPSGEYIPKITPRLNEHQDITFIFEKTLISMDYQIVEAQSGDQLILLRFTDPSPGIWTFKVYGKGDLMQSFHIWLPMEKFISENTYFLKPDPNTTILSFGNATEPITVTAYNPEDDSIYLNSSRGFTRTKNIQPTIAAPGVNILSPTLERNFELVSGSSPAVAHTAGVAAMLLEWGVVLGNLPNMNTISIKNHMIRGARRNPTIKYPNKEWGYGILDVYNIFNSLRLSE